MIFGILLSMQPRRRKSRRWTTSCQSLQRSMFWISSLIFHPRSGSTASPTEIQPGARSTEQWKEHTCGQSRHWNRHRRKTDSLFRED